MGMGMGMGTKEVLKALSTNANWHKYYGIALSHEGTGTRELRKAMGTGMGTKEVLKALSTDILELLKATGLRCSRIASLFYFTKNGSSFCKSHKNGSVVA